MRLKRTKKEIPQTTAEFGTDWFNSIFDGQFGGTVLDVEFEAIGVGIGFIGELNRCSLTWSEGTSSDAPGSVIVKVPRPANRAVGEALNAFEREIVAYRDLSETMGLPMPAFYFADLDPDPLGWLQRPVFFLLEKLPLRTVNWLLLKMIDASGGTARRFVLVMEDIADARPPTQLAGGSIDDALDALVVLASFHAAHWGSERPADRVEQAGHRGLLWPLTQTPKVWQASYQRNRAEFVDRFGTMVGAEKVAKLDDLQANLGEVLGSLSEPATLLHGDFRLDNLLIRESGEMVVVDYQLLTLGNAAWDVAYFITTALSPDLVSDEERMLAHYHEALVAAGRTDYSLDQLRSDADVCKLILAHRCICSFDTLDSDLDGQAGTLVDVLVERVMGWVR